MNTHAANHILGTNPQTNQTDTSTTTSVTAVASEPVRNGPEVGGLAAPAPAQRAKMPENTANPAHSARVGEYLPTASPRYRDFLQAPLSHQYEEILWRR